MASSDRPLLLSIAGGIVALQQPPDNTVSPPDSSGFVVTSQFAPGYNLNCARGTAFSLVATYSDQSGTPITLDGANAVLQIRTISNELAPLIAQMDTDSGSIIIDDNQLTCQMDGSETGLIAEGYYEYDLVVTSAGFTTRLLKGLFFVMPETSASVVVTINGSVTAGIGFTFSVHTATSYAGTIHFTSSDTAATLPVNSTLTLGAGTFTATLRTVGNKTLVATDTVSPSIHGRAVANVHPLLSTTHYSVTASSGSTVGNAILVTVTALNGVNSIDTTYAGTVHFTSSDGAATLPVNGTLTAGVRTFTATLNTVGTQTITATDSVTASITGTGSVIVSTVPTHLTMAPTTVTLSAGAALVVTVTALDAANNVAAVYSGTIHFTSNDTMAVLPVNSTLTAGVGTFTVTLKTAGNETVTVTDTVTASFTATNSVHVNPATATIYLLSPLGGTTVTAGTTRTVLVSARDAFNNLDTNYAGTVHFTSSDTQATLPGNLTLPSGTRTYSGTNGFVFRTAGTQTFTGTDTVTSSITKTGSIVVLPSVLSKFGLVSVPPVVVTAGNIVVTTVTAQDQFNNTVSTYAGTVKFRTLNDTQGVVTPPINNTLVSGVGTFSATLKTAGGQFLLATDSTTASIIGFGSLLTVIAAPASVVLTTVTPATITSGNDVTMTVTMMDPYNNIAVAYAGTIHFTTSDLQGPLLLPDDTQLASGVGTFTCHPLRTAGTQTITASDTVTTALSGVSSGILVKCGPVFSIAAVSTETSVTAGGTVGLTVTARDQFNNTATGYAGTVTFSSTDTAATLPINSTLTSGTKSFSATLNTVGIQTVSAADTIVTGLVGTTANIQVLSSIPGIGSFQVVLPQAGGAALNTVLAFNLSVTDSAQGVSATVAATNGTQQFTFDLITPRMGLPLNMDLQISGTLRAVVVFPDDYDGAPFTYVHTDGAVYAGTFASGTVNLTVSTGGGITAGTPIPITILALDPVGNFDSTYTGTVHFASSDTQAVLPVNSTLTAGVRVFTGTLKTAGTQSVTVNDTVTTSMTGTASGLVRAAAISTYTVVPTPTTLAGGATVSMVVTARDPFNNVATSYIGTVHFTYSDTATSMPANGTLTTGVRTFSATLKTAGTRTVTVSDSVTATISGVSANVTVTVGALASFIVAASPSSLTQGNTISITVTAKDLGNNTATAYSGSVHFTSTDGAATLPGNSTLTSGVRTFSATLNTVGAQTVTGSDSVTATLSGVSNSITVLSSGGGGSAFSVVYNGSDSYVRVPDPMTSFTAVSMAAWIKVANGDFYVVGDTRNGTSGFLFYVNNVGGGKMRVFGNLPTDLSGATSVDDGAWHHVAMTWNGTTLKIYVDGSEDATATQGIDFVSPAANIFCGATLTSVYGAGKMTQFLIAPSTLSSVQVAGLAAQTLNPNTLTLSVLILFSEGTGTTAADTSGNGNNGTFFGGVTWSSDVP